MAALFDLSHQPCIAPLSSIVPFGPFLCSAFSAAALLPMNLFLGCLGFSSSSASSSGMIDSPRSVSALSASIFRPIKSQIWFYESPPGSNVKRKHSAMTSDQFDHPVTTYSSSITSVNIICGLRGDICTSWVLFVFLSIPHPKKALIGTGPNFGIVQDSNWLLETGLGDFQQCCIEFSYVLEPFDTLSSSKVLKGEIPGTWRSVRERPYACHNNS